MDLGAQVQVTAELTVIPGELSRTLALMRGDHWCECHGYHRHDGPGALNCPAEWKLP